MANYSITIKNEDFKKLTQALSAISSFLTDVDIRKGHVRQFNLSKTLILDLDMTNIFDEDLCASNIKAKLDIFEVMANDGKDVTIRREEIKVTKGGMENTLRYWFLDNEISLFRFRWTDSNKLSTKYLNDTEWATVLKDANQQNLITTITLEDKPDLVRKIKKVCETFNASGVAFRNDTTGYSLQVESNDKTSNGKLFSEYTVLPHLTKTFRISANVDFIKDGIVKSITYFKPGTGDQKTEKSSSWMIADCDLNDKISFKTYTICSTAVSDKIEPGKAAPKSAVKKQVIQAPPVSQATSTETKEVARIKEGVVITAVDVDTPVPEEFSEQVDVVAPRTTIPVNLKVTEIKKHEHVIEMEEPPQPPKFDQTPVTVPPNLQTQFTGYPPMNNPVTQAQAIGPSDPNFIEGI